MPSLHLQHEWDLTPSEAIALQKELRGQVRLEPLPKDPCWIAGTDLSYNKYSDQFYAAIVLIEFPSLELKGWSAVTSQAPFPYIPGLLSFREIPALLKAWEALPLQPDLLMCDGQGIAHPRRLGIATHLGLVTDTPAIGCAKTLLTGRYEEPKRIRGAFEPLKDRGEVIGYALCTKDRVNPVYVSPGHRIDLDQSREITLNCARGYRLPEPTRQAHLLVNKLRLGEIPPGVWMS